MKVIRSSSEMTAWSNKKISSGKTIALVPTMGCFHRGHLCLMKEASKHADHLVTSLFVNPLQFGPNEDLSSYPRTFDQDIEAAENTGVELLFAPEASAFYPEGFQTSVAVSTLTKGLCGASRPGHFDGVTTVVAKLFNTVKPKYAVFGQKDFQQLSVIKTMVRDLDWDVEIIGHPIVREEDGLAMSSRNRYLDDDERQAALCISKSLMVARREAERGQKNCARMLEMVREKIVAEPLAAIDYLEIVDDLSLEQQEEVSPASVLAIAVKIGTTRLIDNSYLLK